jgi:hypothetical protein
MTKGSLFEVLRDERVVAAVWESVWWRLFRMPPVAGSAAAIVAALVRDRRRMMTKVLRLIGYWDGTEALGGWPDVCTFVSAVDISVQRTVVDYLRSGTTFVVAAGVSRCRLCGCANGCGELTDGANFVWPEGLAHYVEQHGVRLPEEVVDIAGRGVAADVGLEWFSTAILESDGVSIDAQWWRCQTGAGLVEQSFAHLPGCRRSATVASWDLPVRAEIYVDRVPRDAVTTLTKLRRLLGAAWPFSELRQLLGSQPIYAVTGNPANLYRALTATPDLRPYLFYAAEGDLVPVWPNT